MPDGLDSRGAGEEETVTRVKEVCVWSCPLITPTLMAKLKSVVLRVRSGSKVLVHGCINVGKCVGSVLQLDYVDVQREGEMEGGLYSPL